MNQHWQTMSQLCLCAKNSAIAAEKGALRAAHERGGARPPPLSVRGRRDELSHKAHRHRSSSGDARHTRHGRLEGETNRIMRQMSNRISAFSCPIFYSYLVHGKKRLVRAGVQISISTPHTPHTRTQPHLPPTHTPHTHAPRPQQKGAHTRHRLRLPSRADWGCGARGSATAFIS